MSSSLQRWHPERAREHATYRLVKAVFPGCNKRMDSRILPCGIGIYRTGVTVLVSVFYSFLRNEVGD